MSIAVTNPMPTYTLTKAFLVPSLGWACEGTHSLFLSLPGEVKILKSFLWKTMILKYNYTCWKVSFLYHMSIGIKSVLLTIFINNLSSWCLVVAQ